MALLDQKACEANQSQLAALFPIAESEARPAPPPELGFHFRRDGSVLAIAHGRSMARVTAPAVLGESALLAALAGATAITLTNRETPLPEDAALDDRDRADPALA